MSDNKNQLVLFDAGGVLVKLDYNSFYKRASELAKTSLEKFREAFNNSGIELRGLTGKATKTDIKNGLRRLISQPDMSDTDIKELSRLRFKSQPEIVGLKKQVHESRYSIGIFSNADEFSLEILSEKYPEMFETYGGPKIYSHHVGAIKPDSPMYDEIQAMGFENVVYIDDNMNYVETGVKRFGWNGILFTPYIDEAEAIRSISNHNDDNSKEKCSSKIVKSTQELKKALNDFGIKINTLS
tara:strand:- start:2553 stop:3275 length:723 start_codon:yes stop_codon:yes gene_type:complete